MHEEDPYRLIPEAETEGPAEPDRIARRHHGGLRGFMVDNQYKVMCVSLAAGLVFVSIYNYFDFWWVLSRIVLAFTVIAFLPAVLVILAHFRENWLGGMWWDTRDVAWTTRRSRDTETTELFIAIVLWSMIALAFLTALFSYPHK
jgi:hypothetical protein